MSDADQQLKMAAEEVLSVSQELQRLESVLGERKNRNEALSDAANAIASLAKALQDLPEQMSAWSAQAQTALGSAKGVVEALSGHRAQVADAQGRIETILDQHAQRLEQISENLTTLDSSVFGVEQNMKRSFVARLFKPWVDQATR